MLDDVLKSRFEALYSNRENPERYNQGMIRLLDDFILSKADTLADETLLNTKQKILFALCKKPMSLDELAHWTGTRAKSIYNLLTYKERYNGLIDDGYVVKHPKTKQFHLTERGRSKVVSIWQDLLLSTGWGIGLTKQARKHLMSIK